VKGETGKGGWEWSGRSDRPEYLIKPEYPRQASLDLGRPTQALLSLSRDGRKRCPHEIKNEIDTQGHRETGE